jgi:GAF domain
MTTIDSSLGALVWNLGRTCATGMDVSGQLSSVCAALPAALCVSGAVILLAEPLDASGAVVFASDGRAGWIGDCQRRAGDGPLASALRTGRPLLTPDMARIEPHEVAAAAAEYGFVGSMAIPLETIDGRLGALQLFGDFWRPVEARHADLIRPLVEVLVARLLDVRTIRLLTRVATLHEAGTPVDVPAQAGPADALDVPTIALPLPPPAGAVPLPRRSRHSRPGSARH